MMQISFSAATILATTVFLRVLSPQGAFCENTTYGKEIQANINSVTGITLNQDRHYFDLADAINKTMQLQPSILIQKESVNQNAGILRSSAGDFDWRLESYSVYARLEILKKSEERARVILEKTDALIKADELAAADIQSVAANLADKESSRISGELAVNEARTNLGLAIGMPYAEIPRIPPPAASFQYNR